MTEEEAVLELYDRWCGAFQGMDAEGMKGLFDQDYPGLVYQAEENPEPLYTWAEIAAYWDAAPGLVDRVPEWRELTRKVSVDGGSAFIYAKLQTHLDIRGAKRPLVGELRSLLGLRKTRAGWKIVHYHESRHVDLASLFED
jgi:ketosteroid isomerase-like protein